MVIFTMNRAAKAILLLVTGLIVLIAAGVIFLNYFDWNRAKPFVDSRIGGMLKRPFLINGDLALTWSREGKATDWTHWVPWPHIVANDVIVADPNELNRGNGDNNFVTAKRIMFSVNPLALFETKIVIPTLVLETPDLSLWRSVDGKNNWSIDFGDGPSLWKLKLNRLVVTNGNVKLEDALRKLTLAGVVDTVNDNGPADYGLTWKVNGSLDGAELDGSGKAGTVLSLTDAAPYPLKADIHVGKTRIGIEGKLTKPSNLAALDLRLSLAGANMSDLYPITGIAIPDTPPYSTEGHLIGKLDRHSSDWVYENFNGKVGSSDLSGSLEYQSKQLPARPRPLLTGSVVSNLLLFKDLAPIIGADSNASKANRGAVVAQPSNKMLPVEKFKFERWRSIDADVKFTGRKIVRQEDLPFDNLVTHVYLRDGVMSLLPLQFGVAGGELVSNIRLDGNGALIKAELEASARHIKLKQLSPNFKPMQSSLGEINGDAKLSATGNSVAVLLGDSNGEIKTLISQGTVSKLLLDEAGLNVLNVLMTKLFGDKQVKLNCVAGDFTVINGMVQAKNFMIDTDETAIDVNGQVDLANEHLTLVVKPENKKFRLISFRSPVYVGGSFKDPIVSVDKGALAMRAGGAVALSVLTPFAALLPLVDVGPGKDSECAKLLQQAQTKPQAPPPGKTYRSKAAAKTN
jgi:uncharacterized protein involved in outer membrane biogenesis